MFDALESRVNRAVRDRLSNAVATIGAASVMGIWRTDTTAALNGLAAGATLVFGCESADVLGVARGASVVIGGESFVVVATEPDGAGWVNLILQRA